MLIVKNILFPLFSILVVACTSVDNSVNVGNDNKVLSSLTELKGKYIWNTELRKYTYSKKIEIENILSIVNKDTIIHVLADCINNTSLSNSVLNEKKVKLGVLCYEALSQTIYYEPLLKNGDIALKWAGHI